MVDVIVTPPTVPSVISSPFCNAVAPDAAPDSTVLAAVPPIVTLLAMLPDVAVSAPRNVPSPASKVPSVVSFHPAVPAE